MKSFLTIALIITTTLFLVACEKYKKAKNDADGNLYLHGRVFYNDDITTTGTVKQLGKTVVKIGYPADNGVNYLYTTTADDEGYFVFKNLSSETDYLILADSTVNGIKFTGRLPIKINASLDTARLILQPNEVTQNGFVYTVKDNLGGIVKDCAVCVFSSFVLASRDTCAGSTYQLTTSEYGRANKMNISPGTYVTVFRGGSDTLILKGRDTITITANGIVRKSVIIRR